MRSLIVSCYAQHKLSPRSVLDVEIQRAARYSFLRVRKRFLPFFFLFSRFRAITASPSLKFSKIRETSARPSVRSEILPSHRVRVIYPLEARRQCVFFVFSDKRTPGRR